jgi:hypothetical protein
MPIFHICKFSKLNDIENVYYICANFKNNISMYHFN